MWLPHLGAGSLKAGSLGWGLATHCCVMLNRWPDLSAGTPGRWGAARPLQLSSGWGVLSS